MKSLKYYSVLIINFFLIKSGYTFNLSPIPNHIFTEPALNFVNQKVQSSYFGYQINLRKSSIIIAAPRAQSTLTSQREFNETGAVYKCKIKTAQCKPFVVDDTNGMKPFQEFTKLIKSHQWLGASMDGGSNEEDLLIVCAPNAVSANEIQHSYHGVCYLSENTLNDVLSQPTNRAVKELHPFREKEYQEIFFKDSKGSMIEYPYLEYGQMGHSVQMSKNLKDILIGAPGVYLGSGSIVQYKSVASKNVNLINKFGNMEILFPNTIPSYSYFGYAVVIGNFIGKTLTTYAASAPHEGFVNIFDFKSNNKIKTSNYQRQIRIARKLYGEQLGEYFGYALLAEDFNGDKIDDLAVGAPLYAKKNMYENGKVYVYLCKNSKCSPQEPLFSNFIGNGRFGMTLGKIGDINQDGFNDLAVGAPYDESGKVYIFLGGRNGLATKPSQILSNPDPTKYSFGLGLSKGVDIDANNYNDFAIGAPNSEDVFIFKSYPVIKILVTIMPASNKIGVTDRETKFTICANYSTKLQLNLNIPIMLTTRIDPQLKRAAFYHTTNKSETIEMSISQTKECRDYRIQLSHTLHDHRPIVLEASYHLKKDFREETQFCDDCVAVNPSDHTFVQSKIAISSGCKDTFCMADLNINSNITNTEQKHILGKPEIIFIEYTISNFGETAYFPQISIKLSQRTQYAKIPSNCDLYEATLNCDLDNSMPLLYNRETKFIVSINLIDLIGHELVIQAEALSASNETAPLNNIVYNTIELVEYNFIEINAKSQPTQISFEQITEETLNITHEFEIINYGYSDMKEITFTAYIPKMYNQQFDMIGPIVYTSNRYEFDFEMDELETIENFGSSHEDMSTVDKSRSKRETLSELVAEALQSKIVHIPQHRSQYFNCSDNLEMPQHTCQKSSMKFMNFIPKEKIRIIYNITVNLDQLHQILDAEHNILLIEIIPKLEKTNDPRMETFKLSTMNTLTAIELIQKEKTPLFWIIVSIIVGILVLVGLIYLLNRMGFFRRALKKEIVKIKRETMQIRQSMALRQSMMLPIDENSCLNDENILDE